jgi:uncharacterized protein (DUF362 family)/ferredoxin
MSEQPHLDILRAATFDEVRRTLSETLEARYAHLLPTDTAAPILLKPNLNANMNALTGNTTDLRIIAALLGFFRDQGYTNLTVGEGTNSGFYRNKIGVIARLMVDRLAARFGADVVDLNHAPGADVAFADGVTAQAARICQEAALFINLPKLKTHFEAGMSVCCKNLMGCLVGQENKKKTHHSLSANILHLNRALVPHLHIVDGLVAMEGLGPTRGTPLPMDLLLVGTDPYLMDFACARLARFDPAKVTTLRLAREQGLLGAAQEEYVDGLDLEPLARTFAPPAAGPLASFIHHPKRQKYFLAVRNTPLFTYLAGTDWFGNLLFRTGLRQDVFRKDEMDCRGLRLDAEKCDRCGFCAGFCPLGKDPAQALAQDDPDCIHCLYCFMVCPRQAIEFSGEMGFVQEQMRQYDACIRNFYNQRQPAPEDNA